MSSSTFTAFAGLRRYTIQDRDGYDDVLYTVGSVLRFHADGTADCSEGDGMLAGDPGALRAPQLTGSWSRLPGDSLTFTLQRVRPAAEIRLEAPNGGRDHHYYPASGELDCGLEGTFVAQPLGQDLYLSVNDAEHAAWRHELLGERHAGFPQQPGKGKRDLDEWVTFHLDGDRGAVEGHGYLRILRDGRIETFYGDEALPHDYAAFAAPAQQGALAVDREADVLRFTLTTVRGEEGNEAGRLPDGPYEARLCGSLLVRPAGDTARVRVLRAHGVPDWLPRARQAWRDEAEPDSAPNAAEAPPPTHATAPESTQSGAATPPGPGHLATAIKFLISLAFIILCVWLADKLFA